MTTVLGPGGYPVTGQASGTASTTVQLAANMQQLTSTFSMTNKVGVLLAANMQQLTPAFNMTNAIPLVAGGTVPSLFRSPLAPSDAPPGINTKHPGYQAAVRFSVYMPGTAAPINLLTGLPCATPIGTPIALMSPFGWCFNVKTGGSVATVPAVISGESFTNVTMATICYVQNIGSASQTLISTDYTTVSKTILGIYTNGQWMFQNNGTAHLISFPAAVPGHTYLFIGSGSTTAPASNKLVAGLLDLTTGQVYSSATGFSFISTAAGSTYSIAALNSASPSADGWGFPLRAMLGAYYTPLSKIQQWLTDPWGFWHPPVESMRYMTHPAVAASSVALAANMQQLQPAFSVTAPTTANLNANMQQLQSRFLVQTAGGGGLVPDNPKFIADPGKMMTH